MPVIYALIASLFLAGCASFGPQDCDIVVAIAEELALSLEQDLIDDDERAEVAARYTRIGAQIADLGCDYVPVVVAD